MANKKKKKTASGKKKRQPRGKDRKCPKGGITTSRNRNKIVQCTYCKTELADHISTSPVLQVALPL